MADRDDVVMGGTLPNARDIPFDTSFEGLRGDNELAWRLSHLQRLIAPYDGQLFGETYRQGDPTTHYRPCLDVLPATCLIKVSLGNTDFYACQTFSKLHPYSQFVLKALHDVDIRQPMCFIPEGSRKSVEADSRVYAAIKTTHTLYTLAITHLYYLMTSFTKPDGDVPHPNQNLQAELNDCSAAQGSHSLMSGRHIRANPPMNRVRKDYGGGGILSKTFTKLARCPGFDSLHSLVNLHVGRKVADDGSGSLPSVLAPSGEPSWQTKFAHIVILHPILHLEVTVPLAEAQHESVKPMLNSILDYNTEDSADLRRQLIELQTWMGMVGKEVTNAPLEVTLQLFKSF